MEKENVLELSRKENEGRHDEREMNAYGNASKVGMLVGGFMCVALVMLSEFVFKIPEIGLVAWHVYFAMQGSHSICLYLQLKKRNRLVYGIVYLIFSLLFIVALCLKSLV